MAAFTAIAIGGLAAASAASTVISGRKQKKAIERQNQAFQEQAEAQREANRIQGNEEAVQSRISRRRLAREERRRRAAVVQSATASGVQDSSAFGGASSAIGTSFGQSFARQTQSANSVLGINAANQRAADAATRAGIAGFDQRQAVANNQFFQELFGTGINIAKGF